MKRNDRITWKPVEASELDLKGTTAAIIGGTGGLGRALSRLLVARGASVTVVGQTFRDSDVRGIEFVQADLSLLKEAQRVAEALPAEKLDLLVFTTGIFAAPERQETAEGLERDMAVSYLNRLVMLRAMAPRLGKARDPKKGKPRVFIMGYPGAGQAGIPDDLNAERAYRGMTVHMNTVAGNELLVLESAARYPNACFFGLNPGLIKTNIRSNFLGEDTLRFRLVESMIGLLMPTPDEYAARIVPLLVSPELEAHSGALFDRKARAILPTPKLLDASHAKAFMAASEALVTKANVRLSS